MILHILLGALGVIAVAFTAVLVRTAIARHTLTPKLEAIGLGAVTNFFDTLGIGSFAPTTAYIKFRKMAPDSFLPGILNAGHALPTVAEALIYITIVQVDSTLLICCILAAVAGATLGAPVVVRLPQRLIQGSMGVALFIAAGFYIAKNLNLMPGGGTALSLSGDAFAIAVAGHFILGALMSLGIGLYAPSLMLLSLLGLNPRAVFPIMAGACAFLMPVSGIPFVRSERIDLRIVIGLALGGIPAVLAAAFLVGSVKLEILRWLVIVVVLYAAALLLYSALRGKTEPTTSV